MKPKQDKAEPNRAIRFFANRIISGSIAFLITISAHSQALTGQQIFDRMLRVYAEATTYQDKGTVTTDFYEFGEQKLIHSRVRAFETAFDRRSRRFRFRYETEKSFFDIPNEMVIWSQGSNTHFWWTMDDSTSRYESLTNALAAATGVSGTSSRKIPGLLLTEPIGTGWGINSLKNIKLIGTSLQDKRPCYRLTGIYREKQVAFLWVDQQSFILLRLDEGDRIPKAITKTSMTYRPVINKPVPDQALIFEPPRFFWLWFRPSLRGLLYVVLAFIWFRYSRRRKKTVSSVSPL